MRSHPITFLLSLACALLLAVPFLFPILFPLSWIALVPLFVLIQPVNLRQAFLLAWLTGGITNILGFYWLNHTIGVFGGFPHGLSELIFLGFAAYAGLPIALFALLVRFYGLGVFGLFPALAWVTIEFWFPQLFPWHMANSQSAFLPLIQWADIVGPYGTSFLLVWVNTLVFKVVHAKLSPQSSLSKSSQRDLKVSVPEWVTVGVLLAAVLVYGFVKLGIVGRQMATAPSLAIATVQGDIDIRVKGKITYLESNLKIYKELTEEIKAADLIIWPESAVEAWLPENLRRLPENILPSLPPGNPFFLFGARSTRENPASPIPTFFNSAFLVDKEGNVINHYHKQVLLAFGEYIPLRAVLSKLPGMPPIGKGFTPGKGPRVLDLSPTIKLASLICYEDLMPGLARRFVAGNQANLLINLTNDGWFGDSVAPWQHANLAKWRAIETRRTLVRATNAGLTSIISPKGEILNTLPPFSSGVLTATVPLLQGETFYVRFGDWFIWLAAAALICFLIVRPCAALF